MSSDAAVSPPTRIPHPLHGVIWKIVLGADKLCHVLGNAVVGCEVCGFRGRRGQWTLWRCGGYNLDAFIHSLQLSQSSNSTDVYTCLVFILFHCVHVDIPCVLVVFIYDFLGENIVKSSLNTCGSASASNEDLRLSMR